MAYVSMNPEYYEQVVQQHERDLAIWLGDHEYSICPGDFTSWSAFADAIDEQTYVLPEAIGRVIAGIKLRYPGMTPRQMWDAYMEEE